MAMIEALFAVFGFFFVVNVIVQSFVGYTKIKMMRDSIEKGIESVKADSDNMILVGELVKALSDKFTREINELKAYTARELLPLNRYVLNSTHNKKESTPSKERKTNEDFINYIRFIRDTYAESDEEKKVLAKTIKRLEHEYLK